MFDTKRTEIGELLYRLKYSQDTSVVDAIAEALIDFMQKWKPAASVIVPVPPSAKRAQQPVLLLAEALSGGLKLPVAAAVTTAKEHPELKNVYDYGDRVRLLDDAHLVSEELVQNQSVLLFDDLYRSGATMNAITKRLYDDGSAHDVFALTVTKSRSRV